VAVTSEGALLLDPTAAEEQARATREAREAQALPLTRACELRRQPAASPPLLSKRRAPRLMACLLLLLLLLVRSKTKTMS
jgi:hypothetical protein